MALKIKAKFNVDELLLKMDLGADFYANIKLLKVTFGLTPSEFIIVDNSVSPPVTRSLPVSIDILQAVSLGPKGPPSPDNFQKSALLRSRIVTALRVLPAFKVFEYDFQTMKFISTVSLTGSATGHWSSGGKPIPAPKNSLLQVDAEPSFAVCDIAGGKSSLSKLPKLAAVKASSTLEEAPAPTAAQAWPKFPKSELKSAPMVKLRDADKMYQPVQSTSAGSRYYLVAANKDLRAAARLQSGTLSIRIEGPNWKAYAGEFEKCGFDKVNTAEGYASLHLKVGHDMQLAAKSLGAVLTGMALEWETPTPLLKEIAA